MHPHVRCMGDHPMSPPSRGSFHHARGEGAGGDAQVAPAGAENYATLQHEETICSLRTNCWKSYVRYQAPSGRCTRAVLRPGLAD